MRLIDRLKKWYEGEYVPPPPNDSSSGNFIIHLGHYERPWLARVIDATGQFLKAHWQWTIGTVLAIVAIIVSIK